MANARHLLCATALAGMFTALSAHAQDATIYYTTPTIVKGQPVQAAPIVQPVPVYTPVPMNAPQPMTVEGPDGSYVAVPATAPTAADASYLGEPVVQTSQHDRSVTFVSGGIGAFEKQWFESNGKDFKLKVTYADTTGHHLGDVAVTLTDAAGNVILSDTTDGPYLLVNAKPGTYTLNSTYEGQSQTKKVTIGKGLARTSVTFRDNDPSA